MAAAAAGAPRCALCGATDLLFVAQESGTEVGTGRLVTAGMVACWRHGAVTEAGSYVRIRDVSPQESTG